MKPTSASKPNLAIAAVVVTALKKPDLPAILPSTVTANN